MNPALATADRSRGLTSTPAFRFPPVRRSSIHGGPEVWLVENDTVPLVTLMWVTPLGAALDPPGQEGLAALTTPLVLEGTRRRSATRLAAEVEALGGDLFAGAAWHSSGIGLEILSEDLEIGLDTLCELVQEPELPGAAVARRRRWLQAELTRRHQRTPHIADEALMAALYRETRYASPRFGTVAGLRGLERRQVRAWHRCGFHNRGSKLIAVGRLQADGLLRRLEERVDPDWGEGLPYATLEAAPRTPRVVLVDVPEAPLTELRFGQANVPRNHDDFPTMELLSSILGGSSNSRLGRALRQERGWVYGIGCQIHQRLGSAPLVIRTASRHDDAGRIVRKVLAEIERLRHQPVSADELESHRQFLTAGLPLAFQTTHGTARQLVGLMAFDRTEDDFVRDAERLACLDPESLATLAHRRLDSERMTIVAAGPARQLLHRLADFGEVEQFSVSEPEVDHLGKHTDQFEGADSARYGSP